MGVTLHLGIADEFPSDTKHGGKSFFNEIITATYPDYFKHDRFLNKEEQRLLYPDYDQFDNSLDNFRHINPMKLKDIFVKVLKHLKSHYDQYPLVHWIFENEQKRIGKGTSDDFQYKGYKCHLDGFHNDNNHRQEIQVRRLKNGWETFEWIKADPIINLNGRTFYIKTENKFEQNRDILEELIVICDEAIKADKNLLWIFSN
ncbi:hypothetical protein [Flavicella sediminum]|uniref:hypothetical protein n=1 Tax=Flavicella sediminum TaxID=2585141 RepID=UPI0011211EA1|nr:hypothetical protein [Flavicella sediminum]